MSTLLMTGILFAFAGCTALMLRKRFEEQLPLAVGLVVIVLYVFALSDQLLVGAYVVLGLALAALFVQMLFLIRNRAQKPWRLIVTPGSTAFFLIALWLLYSFRGYLFTEWDDFSHWGLAVKNMSIFMTLPSGIPEATITYTDYPPATTLFSWLWTYLSGGYNEGDVQRALNMMMMCFLLPAMKDQEWKQPGKAVCMSTLLFVLPLLFNADIYRTLQVDGLLGCMVLYALFDCFLCKRDNAAGINMGCTLFLLPLVKEIGFAFALLVLILLIADVNYIRLSSKKALFIGGLTLAMLAGRLSWQWYLQVHRIGEVWNKEAIALENVIGLLIGRGHADHYVIIGRFVERLFTNDLSLANHIGQIGIAAWISLIGIIQHLSLIGVEEKEKKRYRTSFGLLYAGLAIYLLMLLMIYLFLFRQDEAMNLNSFERYLSSYLIPFAGFTLLIAMGKLNTCTGKASINAPWCVIVCIALIVDPACLIRETVTASTRHRSNYELRMQELIPDQIVASLDNNTDRVYLVATGDKGWQYYLGAYQFTPIPIQDGMWSAWPVSNKSAEWDDKTAIQYSSQEWGQVLRAEFSHVYLDTIDERFINDYSTLFESIDEIQNARLYRVESRGESVKLIAVQ